MTYKDGFMKNACTLRVQLDKLSEQAPNSLVKTRIEKAYREIDLAIDAYERNYMEPDDE